MRASAKLTFALLASILTPAMVSADPFVNLDFEQATVPPGSGSLISTADGFPGWTAWYDSTVTSTVYYNNSGLDQAIVALYDHAVPSAGVAVLQGQYVAKLRTRFGNSPRASLSQIGDIPSGMNSLRLLAEGAGGPPIVTVNGFTIPMVRLSGSGITQEADLYGGDISSFAGMTSELRFTSPIPPTQFLYSTFDAVSFSAEVIPEPSVWFLLGTTGLLWALNRRRNFT